MADHEQFDDKKVRELFGLMLAGAGEHVQDVARRCPGLFVRPSGDTPLEGEWELYLVDRDDDDEIVPVGAFSSLQIRPPLQGRVLDELIDRYGTGALLIARPYMPDNSGEILRWTVEIDGEDLPDADVLTQDDPEHPDWMLMFLVRGVERIEIDRWSTKTHPHGPTSVPRTLGQLRRGYRRG